MRVCVNIADVISECVCARAVTFVVCDVGGEDTGEGS